MNAEAIRTAAIQRGRAERRAQGIPAEIESPEMTARLAGLLNAGTPSPDKTGSPRAAANLSEAADVDSI